MSKWDEQILVVGRKEIFDFEKNAFYGFMPTSDSRILSILKSFDKYEVKRRGDMEEDTNYKQLIGYAIIKDKQTQDILVYTRLIGGGEERLHGKSSVGIGGHMNETDEKEISRIIKDNVAREIEEEIGINFAYARENVKFIGLINDDKEEVGKVHIGLVYLLEVDKTSIKVEETDTLAVRWLNSNEAKQINSYESWSEFLKPIM